MVEVRTDCVFFGLLFGRSNFAAMLCANLVPKDLSPPRPREGTGGGGGGRREEETALERG